MARFALTGTPRLTAEAMEMGAVQICSELESLIDIVSDFLPSNVMEIGSEAGGTFYVWCQLASQEGIKISLDKPNGNSGSWRFVEADALAQRTALFQSFAPNVKVITGDSHSSIAKESVRSALSGELLDFLFIDGDHSYEGVKADYFDYRRYVRKGGLIAFHDIKDTDYHRARGCFVADFWNELEGKKKELLSGDEWGGIGVLEN